MKFTTVAAVAATVATVAAKKKVNTMETTVTVVINEDSPKSTHKYGRFDHTVRPTTTTLYVGATGTLEKRKEHSSNVTVNGTNGTNGTGSDSENAAAQLGLGAVGAIAAGLMLVL